MIKRLMMAVLIWLISTPAMAYLNLPIADNAITERGEIMVSGGLSFQSDFNLYGGRFSYGVIENLSLFAGLGIYDVEIYDTNTNTEYIQIGGQYTLPVDMPFDLAIRTSFSLAGWEVTDSYGDKETITLSTLLFGALGSKNLNDNLCVYGFGGFSFQNWDTPYSDSSSETELAITGGALYFLNPKLSFYGELSMIDDVIISLGVRYRFK